MAGRRMHPLLIEIREEWLDLDRRVEALDREFVELARDDAVARRLTSIPVLVFSMPPLSPPL
ncbi:MAG: hypothetical protein E5W38_19965 [Mesorhizobium sp.]|uniref:hypothetical protein n=1 Tax=Mesorhizobium sp. TaxID=1871066 RepID=UPI000FE5F624|nr:hypothetical protein [Mesorhizobium sp.]RWA88112.1 MAG: hypothetical protein EOQ31_21340 [Mesorhizobium sp.]TIU29965.1 MAG: hypothetical protein E5W38_19965 [Mesorhizobium sp.]